MCYPIISFGIVAITLFAIVAPTSAQSMSSCPVIDGTVPVGNEYPMEAEPGYVNAEGVNVRSGPSSEFEVIDQAVSGAYVETIGQAFDGNCETWFKVQFPITESTGWIHASYVESTYPRGIWD